SDALLLWLLVESEHSRRTAPIRSGLLWALACLVKPPCILLGLLLVWRTEARRADGFLLGIAAAFGALALVQGPTEVRFQIRAWAELLGATTPGGLCDPHNQSVAALVCSYGGAAPGSLAFAAIAALLATALVAAGTWCVRAVASRNRVAAEGLAFALVLH